ncbi:type IV secretory system conjugative DNA transfer family protein [Paraconexibacter antarcticus]|uniref:Type IV secretory system conjugative DNA transfer family protein n=1 Tax=Paraconexibacter antarcticus TaxID=2949664 RepID=A0ABY5DZ72_9ACTN|nr:type IV secretory system conjugative DNA transfer family protein [Paraconexibacter antarcticus]UTI66142.1 type IV secretory system conjugative DNA transfer family protein [Paraconexibacter antarcticus]
MTTKNDPEPIEGLGTIAAVVVGALIVAWLIPAAVTLAYVGKGPHLSVFQAGGAGLRLLAGGHLADPASAYPALTQTRMPTAAAWWAAAGAFVVVCGCVVTALVTKVEPAMARDRLGRRPYDWRGSRPRAWARPRDHRAGAHGGARRGFAVGRIDGRPLFTDEEAHVTVIAPTRAGKTTRCVVPWLLEHDGPTVVTSTKRDVLELAAGRAHEERKVWVFDPFSDDSTSWTPIAGCEEWSHALRQGQWLADATTDGDSSVARYWQGEAAKLLAPLLHAAALEHADLDRVLEWVDTQDTQAPMVLLAGARAMPAARQLRAVADLDPRNRGTTYMSAGSVLAAYRYPEVARHLGHDFNVDAFLGSRDDTLFLIAAERHQALLAPVIVSLISSLIHTAIESGEFRNADRRLRILLDEAANIAPLHDLPRMLSQAAGHGVRIATIWQSLAQMRERHGHGAETILANSSAKLFMGSITDAPTRAYITDLLEPSRDRRGLLKQAFGLLRGSTWSYGSWKEVPAGVA